MNKPGLAMRCTPTVSKPAIVIAAATLAATVALVAIFATAKPSEAQDTNIVTIEPIEVGFGAVQVGTDSQTRTIYVRNPGSELLSLQLGLDVLEGSLAEFDLGVNSIGDVLTIGPGGETTLQVRLTPTSSGQKLADLTFTPIGGTGPVASVDLGGTATPDDPLTQPGVADQCTIAGTNQGETITGTEGRDVICARGGNDKVDGRGANDKMFGGFGNDRIKDKLGRDRAFGQGGRDRLITKDGKPRDLVKGGSGKDRARVDKGDKKKL